MTYNYASSLQYEQRLQAGLTKRHRCDTSQWMLWIAVVDVNNLNPTRTVEGTIVITASHDTSLAQNRRALAHCLARSYDASPSTTHRFVRGLARRGRQSHHRVRRGMCYRPHLGPSTIHPLQPSTQLPAIVVYVVVHSFLRRALGRAEEDRLT